MSRRDIEELIKKLEDAGKGSKDSVTVERTLYDEAVTHLGRLEQALDNRPSLIKKLNEKIIKLEGELEILRNETRVNELEKKVQRLEGELQRSYATKNFTLKNGLLEIEKAYRDFISSSPAIQSLWDEITLLLVEDKESLPQHILARRNARVARGPDTEAATALDSSLGPQVAAEGASQNTTSYVQQQVDKFKDYTFTPGALDPLDPNHPNHPANVNALYAHHHAYFPGSAPAAGGSCGGAPDARAGEAVDDRPTGLDDRLTKLREQYNVSSGGGAAVPALEPHWGTTMPAPSPLRPLSLFSDGRPPDASALETCREQLTASLEHLRALFAQYTWAPGAPERHGQLGQQGAAGCSSQHGGGGEGVGSGGAGSEGDAGQSPPPRRQMPDASAFHVMAESLEVSVQRLREYYGRMTWAWGAGGQGGGGGSAQGPAAEVTPDARYFDVQAEAILASVQQLRRQFQEAADFAAAAEAAAAATAGGAGDAGSCSSSTTATTATTADAAAQRSAAAAMSSTVIPNALYFETRADSIAAAVGELLRLYEQSAAAAASGGAGAGQGRRAFVTPDLLAPSPAVSRASLLALTPDARACEPVVEEYEASVQPLVDLFSAFMAHMEMTRGSALWRRVAPAAAADGDVATAAAGEAGGSEQPAGEDAAEATATGLEAAELIRLFAKYARSWPGAGTAVVAAAGLRAPSRAGSIAPDAQATPYGDGGAAGRFPRSVTATTPPSPALRFRIKYNAGGDTVGLTAHLTEASAPPSPLQRFRSKHNLSDGGGAAAAAIAHLSASTSAASLLESGRGTGGGGDSDVDAVEVRPTEAATPVEVLLVSLESRHGRALVTSPEAVAVWRDMLKLLGVDPNSRPLRTRGSPLGTPAARGSASGALPLPACTATADAGGGEAAGQPCSSSGRDSETAPAPAGEDTASAAAGGGGDGELPPPTAEAAADAGWSSGLAAGGVRIQVMVSEEITSAAADDDPAAAAALAQLQQGRVDLPATQRLLQLRANVVGGGEGGEADPEVMAAAAAELGQLRQARVSLTEQLVATQELVRILNKQLTMALESRDDLAVRVETLTSELGSVRSEAAESRQEADVFMRELVEAKVQLAEVQGEYMQVYQALKKALGNEKGMIAKIDELERILAVVGPGGDVALDEDYGSIVGQASANLTPRDEEEAGGVGAGGGGGEAAAAGGAGGGNSSGGGGLGGWLISRTPVGSLSGAGGGVGGGRMSVDRSGSSGSGGYGMAAAAGWRKASSSGGRSSGSGGGGGGGSRGSGAGAGTAGVEGGAAPR